MRTYQPHGPCKHWPRCRLRCAALRLLSTPAQGAKFDACCAHAGLPADATERLHGACQALDDAFTQGLARIYRMQGLAPGEVVHSVHGHGMINGGYGVGDTGAVAGEGPDHDGLYVMEDAHYLEVADVDSGLPVADGAVGDMVVTCLYKDDIYPIIRFNTHDVTQLFTTPSALGFSFQRIAGFLGRSDNMVKLRGMNIFPQALAPVLKARPDFTGEFLCTAVRDASGRDELIVAIETHGGRAEADTLPYRELLKRQPGVEVRVELVVPQALAALTALETRQKPIRLIDQRFK